MSNPKVTITQGTAIVNEILYRLKKIDVFSIRFTEFLPQRAKKSITAARRWVERLRKGGPISADRMEALLKTLNMPLWKFEADLLEQPGFCLSHYGVSFVRNLNIYFAKRQSTTAPATVSTSPSTPSGEIVDDSQQHNDSQLPHFTQFFGPAMTDKKKYVQLLFPLRTPGDSENPKGPSFGLDTSYGNFEFKSKDGKSHSKVYPEGVSGYLAFEDVMAATHITNFVTASTRKSVWVRQEHSQAFELVDDTCIFAFGLGFTAAARDAQDRFDGKLFSIYCAKARKAGFKSDYFDLQYTPFFDGKAETPVLKQPRLRRGHDVALIVRVIPESKPGSTPTGQPWFLCAGRTAAGTTAAAYFLVKRWRDLADLYRRNNKQFENDSLAVVIEHREAKSSGHSHKAPSVIEKSANIYCWDRDDSKKGIEECVAWG